MKHEFFEGVCFEDVLTKKIDAPWVPELKTQRDTEFFEDYPDSERSISDIPSDLDFELFSDF